MPDSASPRTPLSPRWQWLDHHLEEVTSSSQGTRCHRQSAEQTCKGERSNGGLQPASAAGSWAEPHRDTGQLLTSHLVPKTASQSLVMFSSSHFVKTHFKDLLLHSKIIFSICICTCLPLNRLTLIIDFLILINFF